MLRHITEGPTVLLYIHNGMRQFHITEGPTRSYHKGTTWGVHITGVPRISYQRHIKMGTAPYHTRIVPRCTRLSLRDQRRANGKDAAQPPAKRSPTSGDSAQGDATARESCERGESETSCPTLVDAVRRARTARLTTRMK